MNTDSLLKEYEQLRNNQTAGTGYYWLCEKIIKDLKQLREEQESACISRIRTEQILAMRIVNHLFEMAEVAIKNNRDLKEVADHADAYVQEVFKESREQKPDEPNKDIHTLKFDAGARKQPLPIRHAPHIAIHHFKKRID